MVMTFQKDLSLDVRKTINKRMWKYYFCLIYILYFYTYAFYYLTSYRDDLAGNETHQYKNTCFIILNYESTP